MPSERAFYGFEHYPRNMRLTLLILLLFTQTHLVFAKNPPDLEHFLETYKSLGEIDRHIVLNAVSCAKTSSYAVFQTRSWSELGDEPATFYMSWRPKTQAEIKSEHMDAEQKSYFSAKLRELTETTNTMAYTVMKCETSMPANPDLRKDFLQQKCKQAIAFPLAAGEPSGYLRSSNSPAGNGGDLEILSGKPNIRKPPLVIGTGAISGAAPRAHARLYLEPERIAWCCKTDPCSDLLLRLAPDTDSAKAPPPAIH